MMTITVFIVKDINKNILLKRDLLIYLFNQMYYILNALFNKLHPKQFSVDFKTCGCKIMIIEIKK